MKFAKKLMLQLSAIVFSSFMVLSCGDKLDKLSEKIKEVTATDRDEIEKYNQYIDFYNTYLPRLGTGIADYLANAGTEESVNKQKGTFHFIKYARWDEIEKNIEAKPPMKEFDNAAKELIPVSKELDEQLVLAKDYYNAKDYLDDNYAKGQELHTKILSLIKKYEEAYNKFDIALKNQEVEALNKELEQAKKAGNEITYNKILVLNQVDNIIAELRAQDLEASTMLQADLTKIKPLYEEFNKTQKDLRESYQNEEMLKKEGYQSVNKKTFLGNYVDKTIEFKTGVLDLINRVENKKGVDKFKLKNNFQMDREKGTPENLYRLREELIKEYNIINKYQ